MMQMQQQQTYFLEVYRASMRTAGEIMSASIESAQRMQMQQMEAVRGALEQNVRSARELSEVKSMDEIMALQSRLAGAQLERAADFWGKLLRAAGDSQLAMIGQVQNQVGELSNRVRETYQFTAQRAADTAQSAASTAQAMAATAKNGGDPARYAAPAAQQASSGNTSNNARDAASSEQRKQERKSA
jgi:hypothetical protein